MILYEENKGGELVQKTRKTTLKLALAFALKLQKRWKLWQTQNCALSKMGRLQSCQNLIEDISKALHEAVWEILTT